MWRWGGEIKMCFPFFELKEKFRRKKRFFSSDSCILYSGHFEKNSHYIDFVDFRRGNIIFEQPFPYRFPK